MQPFEQLAALDRLVHEPARLALLTALLACAEADFVSLQRLTGLTQGNLASHLARLEEAGLVRLDKGFAGKVPRTAVSLTAAGRAAIQRHWAQLEALRQAASAWAPPAARPGEAPAR